MKIIYIIEALLLIAAINLGIWIYADCFDCQPNYSSSIGEWEYYTPKDTLIDLVGIECEMIISLLNDTLTNMERGMIMEVYERAATRGKMNEYLDYLSKVKPVDGDNRNVIEWIDYKFYEDQPKIPITYIGIYRNFLGMGSEEQRVKGRTITRIDLEKAILSDSLLNARGYQQLYAHINEWPWHYHLYRKPKEEMPLGMQAFLIDRLSREFTFQNKYRMDGLRQIEEMRIKFGLDSSQVFQYQEN